MSDELEKLEAVIARDPPYHPEAYRFIFQALSYTVDLLGHKDSDTEDRHVTGPQLLDGIRRLALLEFGYLARVVFESWGVRATEDWGRIVFKLIDTELMNKTDDDTMDDFGGVYDFQDALEGCYFRDRIWALSKDDKDRIQFPWPIPPGRPNREKAKTDAESATADARNDGRDDARKDALKDASDDASTTVPPTETGTDSPSAREDTEAAGSADAPDAPATPTQDNDNDKHDDNGTRDGTRGKGGVDASATGDSARGEAESPPTEPDASSDSPETTP